jgi:hypothetical protein
MSVPLFRRVTTVSLACIIVAGCANIFKRTQPPVVLIADKNNPVAYWHDVGAVTLNAKVASVASEAEKFPAFPADMATLHLALYDAVMAVDQRYRPFLFVPARIEPDASADAAVGAAGYTVLRALFPSRRMHYEQAYQTFLDGIADGIAKQRGIALGTAAAQAHLAKRATDGRANLLPQYASGTAAGRFRGRDPINRAWIAIRPFTLSSNSQFRPPPPPTLDSAQYTADFNEVKELGSIGSTRRTSAQTQLARFFSETPAVHFTRNFGRFGRVTTNRADAARLLAALYAGYADAIASCLEAKYHYDAWRPQSAIELADTDGNPATEPEVGWKPALATPNHPEYPAAHSCATGLVGEILRQHFGTEHISYTWDSKATGTTRQYGHAHALVEESQVARIYGGVHFRYSTTAGAELGRRVGEWTMQHAFLPQ